MKNLLTVLVLFISSSVFAEKLACNVQAHGFEDSWKDYQDNTFIINYDDNNLSLYDTMIDLSWEYLTVKNDDEHIFAISMNEGFDDYLSSYQTITIYKKNLYLISTYTDESGVTINRGYCR